jgi:hypothetical protein
VQIVRNADKLNQVAGFRARGWWWCLNGGFYEFRRPHYCVLLFGVLLFVSVFVYACM